MSLDSGAEHNPKPKYRVPECDLVMRYQHPEAREALVVPVHLVCNTPEDTLIAHVKANSALKRPWIATSAAHDGVAVICGSGPSLADTLGEIDALHGQGATVFALNGAASFLTSHGIWAEHQVIVDARERTADLIGPAKHHIFASQVHPTLFAKQPDAFVLHVNFYEDHNDFLALLPEDNGPSEFALVGSHGSVGNVSLALAYAMGFREIHVFGFDSSFRDDAGHAFSQPMNVTEPVCTVEYADKSYQCTFTMKSQADVFPRLAYELEDMGAKIHVHGSGYLPERWHGERAKPIEQREREKYRTMWEQPSYRDWAPSMDHVEAAIERLGIVAGHMLYDFGCGTGRATKLLRDRGVNAIGIDIAPNALETDVPFLDHILWEPLRVAPADWGFCTDVMEHIPPEKVADTLANIARNVIRGAYFCIDSIPDRQGLIIGAPLHMTVRPPTWWGEQLANHFTTVEQYDGGVFVCRH